MTEVEILEKLRSVKPGPEAQDIVSAGMVSDIIIKDGSVMFSISVPADNAAAFEPLRAQAEQTVAALQGVEKAIVVLTAERKASSQSTASSSASQSGNGATDKTRAAASGASAPRAAQPQGAGKLEIAGVKQIIAVSSAKGGVGKSTTSVNLALALQANGKKVGILDADIYGPSIPRLLKITDKPTAVANSRRMNPINAYGLMAMSIGLLVDPDTPMVWRGPMAVSALSQMIRDVNWGMEGELDVLIVDMPPGTGDIQLTMAQQVPLSGSVIVSTPQDLALIDARKGIAMFRKVNIPILGIVENMSYFSCPTCGSRHDIFGHGGARATAEEIGVPFLGEIPLHMDIRERSDAGEPVVISEPESDHTAIYLSIASAMMKGINGAMKPAPAIIIE
ncbi:iron-sulfur cluster carrier protein ApbC [uncultured Cohaesibacter sp.]|uniref:iron-sulfur cluster carrier protein ApbC n=1 Tax=uncultured Cohaesibacter sp. TaxID=1002546 RepID=UPI0029C9687A|nr:iron-sulfur cluster carrier protein ApbC [uncultured Cohaesibacter sp.]